MADVWIMNMNMDRDFDAEALVENSTRAMLQTIADHEPALFLILLKKNRDPQYALDAETQERLLRMGLLDDVGEMHNSAKKTLALVRFTEKLPEEKVLEK